MKRGTKRVDIDKVAALIIMIVFLTMASLYTYLHISADFGAICLGMSFVIDGLSIVFINEVYHEVELKNTEVIENEVRSLQSVQRHAA